MHLSKDKILYIFSTIPQTVGAIYGLTITGYIFYISNQRNEYEKNPDKFEIIKESTEYQYSELKNLTIFASLSILFCILNLFVFRISNEDSDHFNGYKIILLAFALSFSGSAILSNFIFILDVIDPDLIEKTSAKIIEKIEHDYFDDDFQENHSQENKKSNDISTHIFMQNYINLENELKTLLEKISGSYRSGPYQNIRQLRDIGAISKRTHENFETIRKYRNALVHREYTDEVPLKINELLVSIIEDVRTEISDFYGQGSLFSMNKYYTAAGVTAIPDRLDSLKNDNIEY